MKDADTKREDVITGQASNPSVLFSDGHKNPCYLDEERYSKRVESNQEGTHPDLEAAVLKYLSVPFLRPVAAHTRMAFDEANEFIRLFSKPIILDSGCGTGESTRVLAHKFPENPVIGLDKSLQRLSKSELSQLPPNAKLLRAELLDFWKLVLEAHWNVAYHALYYPNPWPKKAQLGRRFHAHPIFPTLLKLCPHLELRTNWEIYAREFEQAASLAMPRLGIPMKPQLESWAPSVPETAFERKYLASGHLLWRVIFLSLSL